MTGVNTLLGKAEGIHDHPYLKLGVKPRPFGTKTCKLSDYLDTASLPNPPASIDWQSGAMDAIQMFRNDQIGDCGIAGLFHVIETCAKNAGLPLSFTDDEAVELYSTFGGYNPADPSTDGGVVLVDLLKYMVRTGFKGRNVTAFADVNFRNPKELKIATFLFGNLYWGFNLPEAAQNMSNVWDKPSAFNLGSPQAGSWGGHCVSSASYAADNSHIVTSWGKRIQVTQYFIENYAMECHVLLVPEWIAKSGLSPSGFNFAALKSDISVI